MSSIATPGSIEDLSFKGFAELDRTYKDLGIAPGDLARFGRYAIANADILDTPADVVERGYVLTNPSQIETFTQEVDEQLVPQNFAYFRHEPATLHLGRTTAVPYLINEDGQGKPYLSRFEDAMELPGEDPRITRDVKVRGVAGKIHNGWLISTTVATPKPDDPAYVESIKQVFHWGETLGSMEVVAVLNDTKNATLYPVAADYEGSEDTELDIFARPWPHTSYLRLPDITALTNEAIDSRGIIITGGFLPKKVHGGPSFAKGRGPNYRELDIHEAANETLAETDERLVLHYRLGRYGYELPREGLPGGRLIPLGVIATRAQFPDAPAKTPENGVASYDDVLYGAVGTINRNVTVGRAGRMLVGASDSRAMVADVIRVG